MCKISAVINTYNASEDLPKTLESLIGFDEIVVCDMESTDDTREIAKQYGAKVVIFPRGNYNYCEPARQFAIDSASNDWVFVIDADETVTPQLIEELKKISSDSENTADSENRIGGVLVPRINYVLGQPNTIAYPDYQLRFLDRRGSNWPVEIHSRPTVKGKIYELPSENKELALRHKSLTANYMLERMNRYTTAELPKRRNESVSLLKLIIKPWASFFKSFVLKGGWKNGIMGYICARHDANYKFYTLVKLYENGTLRHNNN